MSTFCTFGLIVTGKGEEQFLPKLFRAVMAHANCTFSVIRRIGQRDPRTSSKRLLKMVGKGQRLPTRDEEEIGLPALRFLREQPCAFVILIDDLEGDRRETAEQVFLRYRAAFDELLSSSGLHKRAAVHFFVNMLEAYYFAHAEAVNCVAGRNILSADHESDVELIPHPKNKMKKIWKEFDAVEHGARIVANLDLNHVMRTPNHCCWLRSLFAWCIERLEYVEAIEDDQLRAQFQLVNGCQATLTMNQTSEP